MHVIGIDRLVRLNHDNLLSRSSSHPGLSCQLATIQGATAAMRLCSWYQQDCRWLRDAWNGFVLKNGISNWRLVGLRPVGLWRMVVGFGLIAMSLLALAAPLAAGTWSLQFLGLFPFAVGLTELYTVIRNPELRARPASYLAGFLAIAVAVLLYLSPALVAAGVVALLLGCLAIDGALKLGQAFGRDQRTSRTVAAVNGMSSLLLALLGWVLWRSVSLELAIGVVVAGYTAAAG